jgi:rare lipoprotein A (peptidoglycan hydrolase)
MSLVGTLVKASRSPSSRLTGVAGQAARGDNPSVPRQRLNRAVASGAAAVLATALAIGCGHAAESGQNAATQRTTGSAKAAARAGAQPSAAAAAKSGSSTTRTPAPAGARAQTAPGTAAATGTRSHKQRAIAPAHPVPAAFEPAPGAASDAEVRSELAQMAAVERAQREQSLSAAAANLEDLLPWASEPKSGTQISVASVFTDYGLGLACGGVLGRNELGVAHKTAPCGTLITFTYGGRSLTVPVIDRGPYIAGREWDLTGATAAALGFPGLGKIEWSLAQS